MLRAHRKSFASFVLVGAVFYLLTVAGNGLTIDVWKFDPYLASMAVLSVLFLAKYFVYLRLGTIHRGFVRYTLYNLAVTIATGLAIGWLVDRAGLTGWLAATIAIVAGMLLRYIVLVRARVIRTSGSGERR